MCASPVLAPHGRPAPPAPATRPSHHRRASRISTHAATRAPQHTSPALPRLFAPCAGSAHCFWHLTSGCTRTRREYDADSAPRKARTHARSRTRAHPLSLLHSLSACLHTQHTAPSARVLRTAPLPPRACLHCTRRARGTLRARSAIRSVRCPVCLHTAQSTCIEPKVHVHAAQSPHGDAARTPRQSPASRRARACRTQYCAHCIIRGISCLPQKENKNENKEKDFAAPPRRSSDGLYDKRPVLVKS